MSRIGSLLTFPALFGVVLMMAPGPARPSKDFSESDYSLFTVPETRNLEAEPPETGMFEADASGAFEEIEVPAGVDFMVRLQGAGWEVREFDTGTLTVLRREEGTEHTDVVVGAHTAGRGYLAFEREGELTRVSVRVEDRGGAAATEPLATGGDTPVEAPIAPEFAFDAPALETPTAPEVPEPSFGSPLLDSQAAGRGEGVPPGKSPERTSMKSQKEPPKGAEKRPAGKPAEEPADGAPPGGGSGIYYMDAEKKVVEVPSGNENEPYRRGVRFQQGGADEKALESYEEYLDECKKCANADEAHLRAAELYLKSARGGEAEAHLERLVRSSSRDYRLKGYLLRADMDYRNGDMKRALEGYAAALGVDPGNRELERKVGDLHYEAKDWESAARFYERSIQNGSADDEAYFRAALIRDGSGPARDLEKAYRHYKALVEKFPASGHREFAEQRIRFLERHFYDYK